LTQNYFETFKLPTQFDIDLNALYSAYRLIQKTVHPDRFVSAPQSEKAQSLMKSTEVNDAFQTLKQPLKRAEYLIKLNTKKETVTTSSDFLMQQMEWEEHLESISNQKIALNDFKKLIDVKYQGYLKRLTKMIDKDKNWSNAQSILNKLKFIKKLKNKINQRINVLEDH
jgi:molecular chaperone HscB